MIRVIRVLEYTYPDVETMERDMMRWAPASPEGARKGGMKMKSAHFIPEFVKDDES